MKKSALAGRRNLGRQKARGFVLIGLIALLTMGGLYWFVSNLTPEAVKVLRQKKTDDALTQARDALLAYALRYRDTQTAKDTDSSGNDDRAMYGYLPLPDLGSSRNNNPETFCKDGAGNQLEGCDANYANITYDSNGMPPTLVGRFPWRTLGTGVLRDGDNECLWLVVSSSHGRIQQTSPPATPPAMNWDTLGQLEIVTATNAAQLQSQISSKHDRPIAIVFSPGQIIGTQNRATSATDDVSQCGGNYDVANYFESLTALLDSGLESERTQRANVFTGSINNASGDTSPDPTNATPSLRDNSKPFSSGGTIYSNSGMLSRQTCTDCDTVANDRGLTLTSAQLFDRQRAGQTFRTDIKDMLEHMIGCLRDSIAAGASFVPDPITGYTAPADKTAGRIPSDPCYDDDQSPLGYFSNYKDQIFVARPNSGSFTVNGNNTCSAVLLFAGQRGTKNPVPADSGESLVQLRHSDAVSASNTLANTNWLPNYLEGGNLTNLTGTGTTFTGDTQLNAINSPQTASQDIVNCIPSGASFSDDVVSTALDAYGGQLTAYDASTRTLTLGQTFATLPPSSLASAMYGCTWAPETKTLGNGMRSYFKFNIADAGEGFTFAIVDGDRNSTGVCGAAYQHLGYSGNNGSTAIIAHPKIGIEFDTAQTAAQRSALNPALNNTLNNGRSDPNYTGGHFGIVYWGDESDIATGRTQTNCTTSSRTWTGTACNLKAEEDDNVHGRPIPPDASARPAPRNPEAPAAPTLGAGIYKLDASLSQIPTDQDIHVRVEITRTAQNLTARSKTYSIQVWLLKDSSADANQIAAMKNTSRAMSTLYPGFSAHVTDSPVIYDIQGSACSAASPCASGQTCGSDNMCYTEVFSNVRLGFTTSQRRTTAGNQSISISNQFTTWLP